MRRADAALYEAKNAGRDCVRVSKPVSMPRQLAG
jgi:PleD family two-component response regulator